MQANIQQTICFICTLNVYYAGFLFRLKSTFGRQATLPTEEASMHGLDQTEIPGIESLLLDWI